MILEVDMGNTRVKWRLRKAEQVIARGALENKEIALLFNMLPVDGHLVERIYVSSVVPKQHKDFGLKCEQNCGVSPQYAIVDQRRAGLVNGYHEIEQMGVDRWLAMLAAYKQCKSACVVVGCGSAVTVDLILESGRHLGSYIGPGLQLMRKALFRETDRVKLVGIDYDVDLGPGQSTSAAVSSALMNMQIGLILSGLVALQKAGGDNAKLIITGGDGEWLGRALEGLIDEPIVYLPELVLDGLSLALDEN